MSTICRKCKVISNGLIYDSGIYVCYECYSAKYHHPDNEVPVLIGSQAYLHALEKRIEDLEEKVNRIGEG